MKKGIFYNSAKSQCSIYESGLMCFESLNKSDKYILEYYEDNTINKKYDFAIFNHHITVNNWINESIIKQMNCKTFCIVLEVGEGENIMPWTPKIFDKYIVIDPTIKEKDNIYAFPRPLENFNLKEYKNEIPVIGSFGFVTAGKNWAQIIEQTNLEFDNAIVKINLPEATYMPNSFLINRKMADSLKSIPVKSGIKVFITHDYMNKNNLIDWCSKNTINFFPYYRNMYGLAAVTDQAISAGKPILITKNKTFRHMLEYIKPFPEITIKQAIEQNAAGVIKMKENWSSQNFLRKFEAING